MPAACGSVARWIPTFLEMGLTILEPIQVRADAFRPYGGFTIAPSQHLMTDIRLENIAAMYGAAFEYT